MDLPVDYNKLSQIEKKLCREQYVSEQKGLCIHCNGSLLLKPPSAITDKKIDKRLFPVGFFKYPVHLHHNHNTGTTIGAVHSYCNAILWQYHGE